MNVYTIYAELAEGVKPNDFVDRITEYFKTLSHYIILELQE